MKAFRLFDDDETVSLLARSVPPPMTVFHYDLISFTEGQATLENAWPHRVFAESIAFNVSVGLVAAFCGLKRCVARVVDTQSIYRSAMTLS